jgi:hypothetical protein
MLVTIDMDHLHDVPTDMLFRWANKIADELEKRHITVEFQFRATTDAAELRQSFKCFCERQGISWDEVAGRESS